MDPGLTFLELLGRLFPFQMSFKYGKKEISKYIGKKTKLV